MEINYKHNLAEVSFLFFGFFSVVCSLLVQIWFDGLRLLINIFSKNFMYVFIYILPQSTEVFKTTYIDISLM